MKISFIGLGNMASAIIRGMCESGNFGPQDILGYDAVPQAAQSMKEAAGIIICDSLSGVAEAEVIVLAVKPQVLPSVLSNLKSMRLEGKLVISIVAGRSIESLQKELPPKVAIIRVMPNVNARVGASTSAYAASAEATDGHKRIIEDIFASIGTITEISESLFSIYMAIASASPAFSYLYIDALARAGVRGGMPKAQAVKIAASAVYGSAKLIMETDEHPFTLVDQVCSPAGTTIEGIAALQKLGFESAVHRAVEAVVEKDKSLR